MLQNIKSFISFLWRSKNQHGVHSPFVFSLVTRCFYDRARHLSYITIKNYRKELLKDDRSLKIRDLGAGSKSFTSDIRRIQDMVKRTGISQKRARLLNRLIGYLNIKKALELGTSLGLGTAAMASGNEVRVTTVEGCPATAGIAKEYFRKFGLSNIHLKTGHFDDILAEEKDSESSFDLVYFDGDHKKRSTLRYFKKLLPMAHNDTVFIFDDIHWSAEMEAAWEEIKAHPAVRVTIDTFFWGLVFFRKEQEKEHFVIRV